MCISNELFRVWILGVESLILETFSVIVSQDSTGKRDEGDSAQTLKDTLR